MYRDHKETGSEISIFLTRAFCRRNHQTGMALPFVRNCRPFFNFSQAPEIALPAVVPRAGDWRNPAVA
jgi:hypothetical protein